MHFLFSSVCVCSLKKKLYLYDCLAFRYKSRVLFLTCFSFVLLLCLCGFSSCSLRRNGFCFIFFFGIQVFGWDFGSFWKYLKSLKHFRVLFGEGKTWFCIGGKHGLGKTLSKVMAGLGKFE